MPLFQYKNFNQSGRVGLINIQSIYNPKHNICGIHCEMATIYVKLWGL